MKCVPCLMLACLALGCGPADVPAVEDLSIASDLVPAGIESLCSDGADNDGDGLVDCADPDCTGQICRESSGICDIRRRRGWSNSRLPACASRSSGRAASCR